MAAPLREGLNFCLIAGEAVFLDISTDRYFRLTPQQNADFLALLAQGTVSSADLSANWLSQLAGTTTIDGQLEPCQWAMPSRAFADDPGAGFPIAETSLALVAQRRFERALKTGPLALQLRLLANKLSSLPACIPAPDNRAGRVVRGFAFACYLRSAADRCLSRSLALADQLARRGCRTHVVFGVKLAPFAAHCWVQADDLVLNETVEEVARYTPILVV
ncbi:pimeloyl-ACP methyl ester carboxylesterase [Novosphingobium hassiacum]|uniref:Pimeloyl-ACP methyl ester carboxylesterase n=1 Tax=Novosphingobium hassiacum TaxID=173676 RepID=A0A7W5ZVT8_9SPHN|nr:lasso peptide biosynthesis B2 protein [Novosphingobium hassiacum]MBB3860875.1 pimeloyl-ACP methyl ester carboxylesterase [Novosphingobium hassiacum]